MPTGQTFRIALLAAVVGFVPASPRAAFASEPAGEAEYRKAVEPILEEFCFTCHTGAAAKGGVSFDKAETFTALMNDHATWDKSLRMVRAGLMPPKGKDRPTGEQVAKLEGWIKAAAFRIDPNDPDPGRVTVRRLNRVEYRNTIRDLTGVDYNTESEFPADDSGHGFDNIADVLTLSPLLMEKYITAARAVVAKAVPTVSRVVAEKRVPGRQFVPATGTAAPGEGPLPLSYYKKAQVSHKFDAEHAGRYQLALHFTANETYVEGVFDYNAAVLTFKADGKVLHEVEYSRQGGQVYLYEFDQTWEPGPHELTVEVKPTTPDEEQVRSLTFRLQAVTVRGPFDPERYVRPPNYERFFPDSIPADPAERREAARTILKGFAAKAFRRPADDEFLDRLVGFAERAYSQPNRTFEAGIAQALTAILASPRFLFREEGTVAGSTSAHPLVDEYTLASRLSYFLWSSMPDDELFRLAEQGKLRENLSAQVNRMLADPKASEFTRHFVGQWLQTRGVESVPITAFAVLSRDEAPDPKAQAQQERFRELSRKPFEALNEDEKKEFNEVRRAFFASFRRFRGADLTPELRRAMRQETEMTFEHIVRNDRSLLELIDGNYTFLNERLARHYGVPGVEGPKFRRVTLEGKERGGLITQASVLTVTSNASRTSPVKRGKWVLEQLLCEVPPPPPPGVEGLVNEAMPTGSLRERMEAHRTDPICSSCHSQMDPIGFSFEHYDGIGRYRDTDNGFEIDPAGMLPGGIAFDGPLELSALLTGDDRLPRCMAQQLLTYALGRGMEKHDRDDLDAMTAAFVAGGYQMQELIELVVLSDAFRMRRGEVEEMP